MARQEDYPPTANSWWPGGPSITSGADMEKRNKKQCALPHHRPWVQRAHEWCRSHRLAYDWACHIPSKKWWHVFWFLVDRTLANAFILFQDSPHHQRKTKTGRRKPWFEMEFRQALSKQLIGRVRTSRNRKLLTALDPTTSQHVPVTTLRGRCRECSKDGKRREDWMPSLRLLPLHRLFCDPSLEIGS